MLTQTAPATKQLSKRPSDLSTSTAVHYCYCLSISCIAFHPHIDADRWTGRCFNCLCQGKIYSSSGTHTGEVSGIIWIFISWGIKSQLLTSWLQSNLGMLTPCACWKISPHYLDKLYHKIQSIPSYASAYNEKVNPSSQCRSMIPVPDSKWTILLYRMISNQDSYIHTLTSRHACSIGECKKKRAGIYYKSEIVTMKPYKSVNLYRESGYFFTCSRTYFKNAVVIWKNRIRLYGSCQTNMCFVEVEKCALGDPFFSQQSSSLGYCAPSTFSWRWIGIMCLGNVKILV